MHFSTIVKLLISIAVPIPIAIVAFRMATKPSMQNLNGKNTSDSCHRAHNEAVYKKPLGLFSQNPVTGFYRDGYCRVGPEDTGNHAVAAQVTDEFLDFTASRGNDLRSAGITAGCKWCLCSNRWKEAMQAAKGPDDPVVPKYASQWLFQLDLGRFR